LKVESDLYLAGVVRVPSLPLLAASRVFDTKTYVKDAAGANMSTCTPFYAKLIDKLKTEEWMPEQFEGQYWQELFGTPLPEARAKKGKAKGGQQEQQ
jgi:hypothetical protein